MRVLRTILILLVLAAFVFVFTGCADFQLRGLAVETPYGTINTDKNGSTTVILKPFHVGK